MDADEERGNPIKIDEVTFDVPSFLAGGRFEDVDDLSPVEMMWTRLVLITPASQEQVDDLVNGNLARGEQILVSGLSTLLVLETTVL